ncbi:hypothetical protein BD414DRAFT_510366 [Trametes punicea]|nr:hypothetical protein BD414DRAFT_510366 [Trametes punicea]
MNRLLNSSCNGMTTAGFDPAISSYARYRRYTLQFSWVPLFSPAGRCRRPRRQGHNRSSTQDSCYEFDPHSDFLNKALVLVYYIEDYRDQADPQFSSIAPVCSHTTLTQRSQGSPEHQQTGMPTLAELREKAAKAKDASVSKIVNTRDRMTSQSSKNINWQAEIKPKPPPPPKPDFRPPPPPSRTSSSASSASGPSKPPVPPVLRRAGLSASSSLAKAASVASEASSPSSNPPPPPPPRSVHSTASESSSPSLTTAGPPPPIRLETRPDLTPSPSQTYIPPPPAITVKTTEAALDRIDWANLSLEDKHAFFSWLDEFFSRYLGPITSYPPHPERGSLAEDLAHYFSPSTHWASAWYTEDDLLAPPLRGNGRLNWTASWQSDGRTKTVFAGVLFADLSMCFYTLSFPQNASPSTPDPNDARAVQRHAVYLPRPAPWDRARLVEAHETYGEAIARFAESFENTGRFCARGECWDLANEALKSVERYEGVPKPVPSICRTHGHLIYEGRAADNGRTQVGRWRGGDDRVRRGDIIEWREAKLSRGPHARWTLGNPDHTAIIVRDMVPRTAVADGMMVPPRALGTVEVVEQSLSSPPKRESYDLAQFEEGEVWIYRPVSMEAYVGTTLTAKCPGSLNVSTI